MAILRTVLRFAQITTTRDTVINIGYTIILVFFYVKLIVLINDI